MEILQALKSKDILPILPFILWLLQPFFVLKMEQQLSTLPKCIAKLQEEFKEQFKHSFQKQTLTIKG